MSVRGEPRWPEDAETIITWANGGAVSSKRLLAELRLFLDYFEAEDNRWSARARLFLEAQEV